MLHILLNRSLPVNDNSFLTLVFQDVSCNEIQTIPPQIGNLESLRDLNVRRNNLVHLPEGEIKAVSCNSRNLKHFCIFDAVLFPWGLEAAYLIIL